MRPAKPPPQLLFQIIVPLLMRTQQNTSLDPAEIEHEIEDALNWILLAA
jgi:hypothetical protein